MRGDIWLCASRWGVWVSQSVPAIARAIRETGQPMCSSMLYRGSNAMSCKRLKTASELNDALADWPEATFLVRSPDCWRLETNATQSLEY